MVFRRADGKLVAVSADYDDQSGTISFETNCLGRFVVVAFDYEGEAFSAGFYEALAELPAVQELP